MNHQPAGDEMEAHAWLRQGVTLLQTIEPGPDAPRQQQQAALTFLQAIREGACEAEVRRAQLEAVVGSLRTAFELAALPPRLLD